MQTHEPPWDLITQPLFPFLRRDGSLVRTSLPGLFAALQNEDVSSFPTLQDHQMHALHAFLVQLAAIAIDRSGEDTSAADEDTWKERLLALTDGAHEPWCLVVEDLSKPAFMQPPVPEGNLDGFKKWGKDGTRFPDEIDMLVTAKNHDVKMTRIVRPDPSHWIYALITVQTMEGFMGRGNYGIARMNGGFSSRPAVSFSPDLFPDTRFLRDVLIIFSEREKLMALGFQDRGPALLWLLPWDGTNPISLLDCDPCFIEICRRIRLRHRDGETRAFGGPTSRARVSADEARGRTGDPWTPIRVGKNENTALTVSGTGFTYQLAHALLASDGYQPGAALRLHPHDPKVVLFTATAMVRGQGKTEGFHERVIPITPRARRLLGNDEGRKEIGAIARGRIDEVADIKLRALKPALLQLLQGAPEKLKPSDKSADPWLARLDQAVDRIFFDNLWASLEREGDDTSSEDDWAALVFNLAQELLTEAFDSMPMPDARRYRAIAAAQRTFYGRRNQRLGPHQKGAA